MVMNTILFQDFRFIRFISWLGFEHCEPVILGRRVWLEHIVLCLYNE